MKNPRVRVERQLGEVWRILQKETKALRCELRPKQPADAFTVTQLEDGLIVSEFHPICMRVTEKANKARTNLYVAIDGSLTVHKTDDKPVTSAQKASAAYFRQTGKPARLKHVFAMHYDHLDTRIFDEFGHPTLHAQVKGNAKAAAIVNDRFNTQFAPVAEEDDMLKGILSNTRLPSAAMDPLCVILQVLGDQVVNGESGEEAMNCFRRTRDAVARVRSDIVTVSVLEDAIAAKCFRSPHWYPIRTDGDLT